MTQYLAGWLGSLVRISLGDAVCWAKTTVEGRQVGSKCGGGSNSGQDIAGVSSRS